MKLKKKKKRRPALPRAVLGKPYAGHKRSRQRAKNLVTTKNPGCTRRLSYVYFYSSFSQQPRLPRPWKETCPAAGEGYQGDHERLIDSLLFFLFLYKSLPSICTATSHRPPVSFISQQTIGRLADDNCRAKSVHCGTENDSEMKRKPCFEFFIPSLRSVFYSASEAEVENAATSCCRKSCPALRGLSSAPLKRRRSFSSNAPTAPPFCVVRRLPPRSRHSSRRRH